MQCSYRLCGYKIMANYTKITKENAVNLGAIIIKGVNIEVVRDGRDAFDFCNYPHDLNPQKAHNIERDARKAKSRTISKEAFLSMTGDYDGLEKYLNYKDRQGLSGEASQCIDDYVYVKYCFSPEVEATLGMDLWDLEGISQKFVSKLIQKDGAIKEKEIIIENMPKFRRILDKKIKEHGELRHRMMFMSFLKRLKFAFTGRI